MTFADRKPIHDGIETMVNSTESLIHSAEFQGGIDTNIGAGSGG